MLAMPTRMMKFLIFLIMGGVAGEVNTTGVTDSVKKASLGNRSRGKSS